MCRDISFDAFEIVHMRANIAKRACVANARECLTLVVVIVTEGSIGRAFSYSWALLNFGAELDDLRIFVASEASAILEIPSSFLPAGESLEVELEVRLNCLVMDMCA